jgi:hypothetical protein
MKDVVSDEAVQTKFNSYFLTFGLFSMNFENWMNGKCISNISFVVLLEHEVRRDPATSEENRSRC